MKQFTIDDVLAFRPCGWDDVNNGINYTREKLEEFFAGRKTLTFADVVNMQEVPPEDVVWLACRIFTPRQRVVFALKCAEDAGISAWETKWAAQIPRSAAWDARQATRAARYAAGNAWYAVQAARDAALAAAWVAAWTARDATWAAALDAAQTAAERQLLFITETLEETE